jgi:disulfide bond formation protein DsbB
MMGALGFQYIWRVLPCEVCHWQRWPHIASAILGLGGGALLVRGQLGERWAGMVMFATIALVAFAGLLGVYHAGVEWGFWGGPAHCSGPGIEFKGLDELNNEPAVRCDKAAWRFLEISLAGYNALISLGAAAAAVLFGRKIQ